MSAPSFSSFPPSFSSFPDLDAGQSTSKESEKDGERRRTEKRNDGQKRRNHDERHLENDGGKKRRHKHERKSRRSRSRDEARAIRRRRRNEPTYAEDYRPAPEEDTRSRSFFEDRKGDPLNVTYGSLHSGDVPRYRPISRGYSILGLSKDWTVVYRGGKGVEITRGYQGLKRQPDLSDKKTRGLLSAGPARRLHASAKSLLKYEENDGFIRIPSRKGKEKEQIYRSIEEDKDENSDSESASSHNSDSSGYDSDTVPFSAREEALRSLEQKVKDEPTSIKDWLHFLAHSLGEAPASSKNATVARADISVSILRRALAAHEQNKCSVLLRLKYLRAAEALWHQQEDKLSNEWEVALEQTNSTDIWMEWLDWTIRRGGKSFDDVIQNASRVLGCIPKQLSDEDMDVSRLRVFWRVAECMKQAGYVERCTALFQAQAELSFFTPDSIKEDPFDRQVDALEEFWDTEKPRIGESSAKGWKNDRQNTAEKLVTSVDNIDKINSIDPVELWLHHEWHSDKRLIVSRRTTDMIEDDPFTTVLFSDIRSYLIPIITERGRKLFRLFWLVSLGLHVPGLTESISDMGLDDRWADSALANSRVLRDLIPSNEIRHMIKADSYAGVTIGREKKFKWCFDVLKEWKLGVVGPFDTFTKDGRGRMWDSHDSSEVHQGIVRCIFKQLRSNEDGLDWDILSLAFEASCGVMPGLLKQSQALLASNSSSPELLATHAKLERINGKPEKARKVYSVALSSLPENEWSGVVQLYWDAAEFEWLSSRDDAALKIILRAAGQTGGRTGVQLLRAKRRLEELAHAMSGVPWKHCLFWIKLRILIELLTGTLENAIEFAERCEKGKPATSPQHEAIVMAKLLLVYNYTKTLRNPAATSVLRGLVKGAIEIYPDNTIVLGLFLECEKGEGVWGRVRGLTSEYAVGTVHEKSIVRRIFDVWIGNWEEGRWLGEIERIRAGLEAAINSDRTRGSPILWKIFVKFEVATGDLKKAKATLLRAMNECPLVKELYLLAFEADLRPAFSKRELLYLADAMAERGIRLRRSLGEMMDEFDAIEGEQKREQDSGDEGGDSELEYNSRELRRLMPY